MSLTFPADWPDDCPPDDASPAEGHVFRIVKRAPPVAADFLSHHELGRLRKAPACLRCGLSVFRDLYDAMHQRQLLPKLGTQIAEARLEVEYGWTKLTSGTQPTHTTWWAFEGVNRAQLFAIVKEET